MNFFAQMEMGCDRVFEELSQQIADEQQQHRNRQVLLVNAPRLPDENGLRDYLKEGDSKHKTGAQSQQILETLFVSRVEFSRKQDQPADNIRRCCKNAKDQKL